MRFHALVPFLAALATAGCAVGQPQSAPASAELAQYETLRGKLERRLDAAMDTGFAAPSDYPYAARLWTADSRLGPWLLASGFQESRTKLAALRERGVHQADVAVAYPILSGEEARSDEYRRVYRELAVEARRQGFTLRVISGPQYRDTYRLRGYPVSEQCEDAPIGAFAAHAETVAAILNPDFLSLDLSPATLGIAEGCERFAKPAAAAALALAVVDALDTPDSIRVGISLRADEHPVFLTALLESDLDFYLDINVFRLNEAGADHLESLETLVRAARTTGRDVAVGGYWLQKSDAPDDRGYLGLAYSTQDAAIDTLDIWEPLDKRMHRLMHALREKYGLLYASAYRSDLLFSYLPTQEVLGSQLEPVNMLRLERSKARQARIDYLKRLAEERRASVRVQP